MFERIGTRKVQRLELKLVPRGRASGEAPDTPSPENGTGEKIVQAQKKFWGACNQ